MNGESQLYVEMMELLLNNAVVEEVSVIATAIKLMEDVKDLT